MGVAEEWRPIPGNEGYEASTEGRIRNARTGHVLKQVPARSNAYKVYFKVCFYKKGRYFALFVHRLVLMAFAGMPPEGKPHACHLDDDPANNRPDNLAWGSAGENMRMKKNYQEAHAVPLLERGDAWEDGADMVGGLA